MLVRTSSSETALASRWAALTGRVPGPNTPPIIEQAAIKRGTKSRERRKDDNTDLQETVFSIGREWGRGVPNLNGCLYSPSSQFLARDRFLRNVIQPPHLIA